MRSNMCDLDPVEKVYASKALKDCSAIADELISAYTMIYNHSAKDRIV